MAYNQDLAARIRRLTVDRKDISEISMFGGLAFMVRSNMFCGVINDDLMVRVGPDEHNAALAKPGARPMDFPGRPSRGMVFVGPQGYQDDASLTGWVNESYAFAGALPEKKPRKPRKARSQ